MRIIGIDYGRAKIGIATGDSDTRFAEPLKVIRYEDIADAVKKINEIVKLENASRIILGVSEGRMAEETREFAKILQKETETLVKLQDETLTTHDAQELSILAQIKRKKRREMEDAYSAAIMLQNYLETLH